MVTVSSDYVKGVRNAVLHLLFHLDIARRESADDAHAQEIVDKLIEVATAVAEADSSSLIAEYISEIDGSRGLNR